MDDATLISALVQSYKRQLLLYQNLAALVQKTLSQVVLSRGDVSGLVSGFVRKKILLDGILKERAETEPYISAWQERKSAVPKDARTAHLDELLEKTQKVIQEFMEGEEQLKKYLEHVVKKGSAVS